MPHGPYAPGDRRLVRPVGPVTTATAHTYRHLAFVVCEHPLAPSHPSPGDGPSVGTHSLALDVYGLDMGSTSGGDGGPSRGSGQWTLLSSLVPDVAVGGAVAVAQGVWTHVALLWANPEKGSASDAPQTAMWLQVGGGGGERDGGC